MATEVFNSEDAPLDLLNECCTALNLKIERKALWCRPKFEKKLEAFLPPQCLLCRNKEATTKVHPCEHLLTCEECSNVPLKRCLRCLKPVTSRGRVAISLSWKGIRNYRRGPANHQALKIRYNIVEQGYQMLLKWFQSCDPAKRTPQTLKEALLETECFSALECLLSDFS
ncbi:Hypothetical predicted protein [Octopus vulgaris]|uniref:Uncharacterized protein n=1 Tax=Octopus vulgaris TaxID=6645 RepID=A0AA36HHE3_OCTVU|nr:Hypothetical predicted protein [Octopus vulgaris]